jgi:hypothetical protein
MSAALLFLLPGRQDAQKPLALPEMAIAAARGQASGSVYDLLETPIDIADFQKPQSLKETLEELIKKVQAAAGREFPLLIDTAAFAMDDPSAPDVYETKVQFPPFPKKMTASGVLDFALKQVATRNACFVVKADVVLITTMCAIRVEHKLGEGVVTRFSNRRLTDVLEDLAKKYGMSIFMDQRVGAPAEKLVSATFRGDMNLAGVLKVLTESADLKIVLLNGGLFVTTPARAEELRAEARNRESADDPLWPRDLPPGGLPRITPGGAGLPGNPGGPGGLGLPGFPGQPTSLGAPPPCGSRGAAAQ